MLPGINLPLAFLLNIIFGEPMAHLHPLLLLEKVVLSIKKMGGKLIPQSHLFQVLEIIIFLIIISFSYFIPGYLIILLSGFHPAAGWLFSIFLFYSTISLNKLVGQADRIYKKLSLKDSEGAEECLLEMMKIKKNIPSRKMLVNYTIESMARNTSCDIIGPLFFGFIGGPQLAVAYKAVTIVYSAYFELNREKNLVCQTAKFLYTAANYIPDRLTVILTIGAATLRGSDPRDIISYIINKDFEGRINTALPEDGFWGALGQKKEQLSFVTNSVKKNDPEGENLTTNKNYISEAAAVVYLIALLMVSLIIIINLLGL